MAESRSSKYVEFTKSIENIDKTTFPHDEERRDALEAARSLCTRLERPWDTLYHQSCTIPGISMATKTALDMGLFHKINEDGGTPKTSSQLAEALSADELLVSRILKHLSANDMVAETAPNTFAATQFTTDMARRDVSSCIDFLFDMVWPSFWKAPGYLEKTGYKNPTDTVNGVWQYAMDAPDTPFFAWLGANPRVQKNFIELMSGYTSDRENWAQVYPTEELLIGDKPGTLIVDVGGNIGSDLERFLKKHPEASGRVVLQDQEAVLSAVKIHEAIEPMPHDFFTPQPVKGARAYFLHSILHDWSDEESRRILENLRPAFEPGYSRLLLSENVIPSTGARPQSTAMDLMMMNITGASERSEEQWTALLASAGYKIVKIHPGRIESVIEAEPA